MIIVASTNGTIGIKSAMDVLRAGGSAVDAVETGIRWVEDNPDDHGVGYGGYPNLLGQVELDAGIMDGCTLRAGAVGAMQGYRHPISAAREVMEKLPHVFLVGSGAERFAREVGCEPRDLLTEEAHRAWAQWLAGLFQRTGSVREDLGPLAERADLWEWVSLAESRVRSRGTVDLIAQDGRGDICAGVSTSGLLGKYPGRVGDSPIIGAGLYADNRYGAAACTGMGEMAIRVCTAHSVVLYLKMGLSLTEAGRQAMEDLHDLNAPRTVFVRYPMSFIAIDQHGGHAGFGNIEDRTYIYMTGDMNEPEEVPRILVRKQSQCGC